MRSEQEREREKRRRQIGEEKISGETESVVTHSCFQPFSTLTAFSFSRFRHNQLQPFQFNSVKIAGFLPRRFRLFCSLQNSLCCDLMAAFISESHVQSDAFSPKHPSASPFSIPGFFIGFSTKTSADNTDSARSPTSPLDLVFSTLKNPFGFGCQKPSASVGSRKILHCTKVGLGIVNSLADEVIAIGELVEAPDRKNILIRPQIKKTDRSNGVLVTPEPTENIAVVTSLPTAIGRGSHVNDSLVAKPSSLPLPVISDHTNATALSAREIELSEDYTCVICHGPNPKTTHIFGDYILKCHTSEGGQGIVSPQVARRPDGSTPSPPSSELLSFCHSYKNEASKGENANSFRSEEFLAESFNNEDMFLMGFHSTTT